MADELPGVADAAPEQSPAPPLSESPSSAHDDVAAAFDKAFGGNGDSDDWSDDLPDDGGGSAQEDAGPTEEPQQAGASERQRDERGRFVRSQQPAEDGQQPSDPNPEQAQAQPNEDVAPAPDGFSADAWKAASPEVRQEVGRALEGARAEVGEYRRVVDVLRPYAEEARQYGMTVQGVLDNYKATRAALQSDPFNAFVQLAKDLNVNFEQVALRYLNAEEKPDTGDNAPPGELEALRAENKRLTDEAQRRTHADQQVETQRQAEARATQVSQQFFEQNPDANNHRKAIMNALARMNRTDDWAGDLAHAWMLVRSTAAPAPPKEEPPAAPAAARLQVSGAPSSGATPSSKVAAKTAQDAVRAAFQQAGL